MSLPPAAAAQAAHQSAHITHHHTLPSKANQNENETQKDHFLLSTNPSLLSRPWLHAAFASEDMYWASPVSDAQMETLLSCSEHVAIYHLADANSSTGTQVGFARLITDRTTTAYLSDVYVSPAYRGRGLAGLLMQGVEELLERMEAGRRVFLVVSPGRTAEFYARTLGVEDCNGMRERLVVMSKKLKGARV